LKITFVDTGVLIQAARGTDDLAVRAHAILDDPEREFASSDFVKLEVMPKPIYNKYVPEAEFYEIFFDAVKHWSNISEELVEKAYHEACQAGLSAMDALHVAAAISVNANELVTTEKPEKPLHRITAIKVVSIA